MLFGATNIHKNMRSSMMLLEGAFWFPYFYCDGAKNRCVGAFLNELYVRCTSARCDFCEGVSRFEVPR